MSVLVFYKHVHNYLQWNPNSARRNLIQSIERVWETAATLQRICDAVRDQRWQQLVTSPPFLFLILHQWKPQPASSPDDKRSESINSISSSSEGPRYTPSVWFFVSVNRTLNELSQVPFGWHTIHKDIISKTLYFSSSSVIVRDRAASKLVADLYWLVSFALMLLAVKNAVTFEQSPLVLVRLLSL